MREAVGQSSLYTIVIVFLFVALLILMCSLSYSKSYKAKNKIISLIEDNRGYDASVSDQIDTMLRSSGYRPVSVYRHNTLADCPAVSDGMLIGGMDNYSYCIYEHSTDRGKYYTAVIYMRLEIPVISSIVEIPVHGDTRTIYNIAP